MHYSNTCPNCFHIKARKNNFVLAICSHLVEKILLTHLKFPMTRLQKILKKFSHMTKLLVIQFSYLYEKPFSKKKFEVSFSVTSLFNCSQKAAEIVKFFLYGFAKMYENCMASYFSVHLMYGIVSQAFLMY